MRSAGEAALRGAPTQHRVLRRLGLGLASLSAVLIAGGGTLAGPDVGFDFLCLWPIGVVTWLAGFPAGFAVSLASATASLGAGLLSRPGGAEGVKLWNFAVDLGVYLSQAGLLTVLHARMDREGRLARTDEVTHIANRRAFEEAADRELERARRQGRPVTLAYMDVDDFKRLNDRHGHAAGDEVLEKVGAALSRGTRRIDTAARLGGDEFGLILPDTSEAAARVLLERLRTSLGAAASGRAGQVTLSIGAVTFEAVPGSVTEMVARADAAMYQAKRAGRGWIRIEVVRGDPGPASDAGPGPAGPEAPRPGRRATAAASLA
jgi:diguanylate cyclase (GGDEF)-like protein